MAEDFDVVGKIVVNDEGGQQALNLLGKGLGELSGGAGALGPALRAVQGVLTDMAPELIALGLVIAGLKMDFDIASKGIEAFKESIHLAAETEQADVRLQAIIVDTQKLGGVTLESAKEMARGFEELTGVDQELVKSSEAMLLTFPNISKNIFPQAEQAALDLSAALGQNLEGATRALGMALESPTQGMMRLRREGIILDEAIQNQIKSMEQHGRLAAADALLLSEVEKRVKGVAEAMGSTFQGEIGKVNNLFEDLSRDIGGIFLPVAAALLGSFRVVAEEIVKALGPALQQLKLAFGELAKAMTTPEMKEALKGLGKEIGKDLADLLQILVKVGVPAIKEFAANWKQHGPEILKTLQDLVAALDVFAQEVLMVADAADRLSKDLAPWIELGKNIVKGIVGGIIGNPKMVSEALQKIIDLAIADIKHQLGIASPSAVMALNVGRWIPAGVAMGINDNMGLVQSAMQTVSQTVNQNFSVGGGAPAAAGGPAYHLYNPVFNVDSQDTMDTLMARMNVMRRGS